MTAASEVPLNELSRRRVENEPDGVTGLKAGSRGGEPDMKLDERPSARERSWSDQVKY